MKSPGLGIQSILVPVDGSESSRRAVTLGAKMAQSFHATLTLLYVIPIQELPVLMSEAEDPNADAEAMLVLGQSAKLAGSAGTDPVVVVRRGHAARQILRYIQERRPDLVLLGTRKLTGAKGLVLGSVSRAVSLKARTQVVLVP